MRSKGGGKNRSKTRRRLEKGCRGGEMGDYEGKRLRRRRRRKRKMGTRRKRKMRGRSKN